MLGKLALRGSTINRQKDTWTIGGVPYRRAFAYERMNRYQFKQMGDDGNVCKFEVRDGDIGDSSNIVSGNERSELVTVDPLVVGSPGEIFKFGEDGWLGYYFRIDTPLTAEFSIFGQFHDYPEADDAHMSPPLGFTGGKSYVHADGTTRVPVVMSTFFDPNHSSPIPNPNYVNRGSFEMIVGKWYFIVLHFRASLNNTGSLELWVNGTKISNIHNTSFGYNNDTGFAYWQWGIYRKANKDRAVIYYANMKIGRTSLLNLVANPPPVPVLPSTSSA